MYTFVDAEGTTVTPLAGQQFVPTPGGSNGSGYALRMRGTVATAEVVYAGLGINLVEPKGQYDASRFGGVSFYARRGPDSTSKVRLKVPDVNTDPDGQVCGACFNDFGVDLRLKEEWQKFTVPFSRMKQLPGWGAPTPSEINTHTLYSLQFQVNDPGKDYDIWIDDLQFTGCEGSG